MTIETTRYFQKEAATQSRQPISRVQWLALLSGLLGWLFDSMDLNLFTLVLFPAVAELTGSTNPAAIAQTGGYIVAIKLLCWGLGGIAFGVVADRFGRSRTMVITIIIYAVFTGLSGLARTWGELAALQAVAGLGIGGEWAAGAALVAESWPQRHRAKAMQAVQLGFAFGFFLAALDNLLLGPFSWRWVFAAGALPAIIALFIRRHVAEPERWLRVRAAASAAETTPFRTFSAIFGADVRRRTIVGVLISASMMIGSWGGLALLPSWIQQFVRDGGGTSAAGVESVSYAFMLMMAGATLGYLSLILLTDLLGRRGSYFLFATGSLAVSLYLFWFVTALSHLMLLMPVYGFFVIGGFGTFAAYLPELFPTRIRASGQGFCWNAARCVTALGPLAGASLIGNLGSFQAAAASTSLFFAIGMVAIWWGPETRGRPLED